jgi:hypothetical protein
VSYQIVIVGFDEALAAGVPKPALKIDKPTMLVHAAAVNARRCHRAQRVPELDDLSIFISCSP